jgi:hypothetical protein
VFHELPSDPHDHNAVNFDFEFDFHHIRMHGSDNCNVAVDMDIDASNSALSGSEPQVNHRPRSWVDLSLDFSLPLAYHLSPDPTPFDHVERERNKLRDRCSKLKPVVADAPSVQCAKEISIPLPSESHSRAADLAPRQEFVVLPILEFPVIPDAPEASTPVISEPHSPSAESSSSHQHRSPFKSIALEMPSKSFASMHALKMLDADIAASSGTRFLPQNALSLVIELNYFVFSHTYAR